MGSDSGTRQGRVVFVHHSVGRYMLARGQVRKLLAARGIALWDCDYNKLGTRDGEAKTIEAPAVPDDNTDPDGFLNIFTRHSKADERFIGWLADFELVALKSCYPASNIQTDDELRARQRLYEQLVMLVGERLAKTVLLTPPPLAPLRTSRENAARAGRLARWMATDLRLPTCVTVFDLHGVLACPKGEAEAGMLQRQYRRLIPFDSHPNTTGARVAGERFAEHIERVFSVEKGVS